MITIDEKYDSRGATTSEDPSVELLYVVQGTEDDLQVKSLVATTSPLVYDGLERDSFTIKPLGGGLWEVSVRYVKFESTSQFTFDTGGGSQHVNQSLETIDSYAAPDEQSPDFQGAIGVNEDRIEGTDVTVPVYNFTETHYIDDVLVTGASGNTFLDIARKQKGEQHDQLGDALERFRQADIVKVTSAEISSG